MKCLDYSILRGDKTYCAPDWEWLNGPGVNTGFNLWFIVSGTGSLETARARYTLHPGDCFLLRMWDFNHGWKTPEEPLVVSWICFDGLDKGGKVMTAGKYSEQAEFRHIPDIWFFDQLLQRVLGARRDGEAYGREAVQWLKTALLEIERHDRMSHLSGVALDQSLMVDALCGMMREQPEQFRDMEGLARQAKCSVDHLIRIFRRHMGVTPWEFMIRCRVEKARSLLRFSRHTVSQIADLLGYADIYGFCKQFKARTGQTPSEYRKGEA